jgi:hypothetical protein
MEKSTVEISGDNIQGLLVRLEDVLGLIPKSENVLWSILNIKATGNKNFIDSVLSFENKVKQSKNGLLLNTSELDDLARHFSQIIETLIIGDSDIEKLRRYNTIEEAFKNCNYVFELVDSSYWIINAQANFIDTIKKKFGSVRTL